MKNLVTYLTEAKLSKTRSQLKSGDLLVFDDAGARFDDEIGKNSLGFVIKGSDNYIKNFIPWIDGHEDMIISYNFEDERFESEPLNNYNEDLTPTNKILAKDVKMSNIIKIIPGVFDDKMLSDKNAIIKWWKKNSKKYL